MSRYSRYNDSDSASDSDSYSSDSDDYSSQHRSGKQGFASMSKDKQRAIASKGGRTQHSSNGSSSSRSRSHGDEHSNRVEGGRKAAETRRQRGTGYFENNSREEQAELGRRGGSKGGRHNNESHDDRRERGLKAAETRRQRGTGYFENNSHEEQSELGRRGGSKGGKSGSTHDNESYDDRRQRGLKAAETRRQRGTGYFENNSREQQAELGRRGGSKGGQSRRYDSYSDSDSEDDY